MNPHDSTFLKNFLAFCILIWSKYINKININVRMSFFWRYILLLYILIHFMKSLKGNTEPYHCISFCIFLMSLFLFLGSFLYYLYLQYISFLKKLEKCLFWVFPFCLFDWSRSCILTLAWWPQWVGFPLTLCLFFLSCLQCLFLFRTWGCTLTRQRGDLSLH